MISRRYLSKAVCKFRYSREDFIFAKLRGKIIPLRNGKITLSFTELGNQALVTIFNVANMSSNAIRKDKILSNISFTVVLSTTCLLFKKAFCPYCCLLIS